MDGSRRTLQMRRRCCCRSEKEREWRRSAVLLCVAIVMGSLSSVVVRAGSYGGGGDEMAALRQRAAAVFYHGYEAYQRWGFPADEVLPLSCAQRVRGVTPSRGTMDDALGNFCQSAVDAADMLVVLGDYAEFTRAVGRLRGCDSFDR